MISVLKITPSTGATRVRFADAMLSLDPELLIFDGRIKAALRPRASFVLDSVSTCNIAEFLYLAPGVLVIQDADLLNCDDMYYLTAAGTECLRLSDGTRSFTAINPVEYLPPPSQGSSPCIVDKHYMPLFRIIGMPQTDLFTTTGFHPPGTDFAGVYERFGFRGLCFETVWTGERTRVP